MPKWRVRFWGIESSKGLQSVLYIKKTQYLYWKFKFHLLFVGCTTNAVIADGTDNMYTIRRRNTINMNWCDVKATNENIIYNDELILAIIMVQNKLTKLAHKANYTIGKRIQNVSARPHPEKAFLSSLLFQVWFKYLNPPAWLANPRIHAELHGDTNSAQGSQGTEPAASAEVTNFRARRPQGRRGRSGRDKSRPYILQVQARQPRRRSRAMQPRRRRRAR